MADSLCPSSATQALVLAGVAQEDARRQLQLARRTDEEDALALYDEAGAKRKSQFTGNSVPKKGKRWGLLDDKPFKPLPYVDLPVGLEDDELDQFLREQRLEDLHVKIQRGLLDNMDPDIRPPSPPPIYDKGGNRLNTREIRVHKSMMAEYNRLIRYMMKTIEGYLPPETWKPQKLVKKVLIPVEKYPTAPFMGVIIGARGVNHKRLQEVSGCRIFIRGRDVGDKFQTDEEQQMPPHVHIEGDTEEQIEVASKLVDPLLNPESPEFEYARTHGMQQLATVTGFTLKGIESRCSICGAIGHLGFDCPEAQGQSYKMAEVTCAICGDKGHIASDCKQAAAKHQRENVDWKEEAEKKHTLNAEYMKMMGELGAEPKEKPAPYVDPYGPPMVRPGLGAQSEEELSNPAITKIVQMHRAKQAAMGGGSGGYRPAAPPPPPPAWQQAPLQPRFQQQAPVVIRPPWASAGGGAVSSSSLPIQPPNMRRSPDVDDSILCPPQFTALASSILAAMSLDTGAKMSLDYAHPEPGGQRVLIQGTQQMRERAKLHFRAWLSVQTGSQTPDVGFPTGIPPGMPPGMDFAPHGFPPSGFPPGAPSMAGGAFPPSGFPPSSFPPGMNSNGGFPPNSSQPVIDLEDDSCMVVPPGMPEGFGVTWDEL